MSAHQRVVIAVATAKAGMEAELGSRLRGVAEASWHEPGVVTYAVHDVVDQPGQFLLIEVYSSDQAFDDHLATDHVTAFLGDMSGLIEGELFVVHSRATSYATGPKGLL
jgi:quinol monooxygenase YgiN